MPRRTDLLAALQRAAILSNEKFRGVRLVLGPRSAEDHLHATASRRKPRKNSRSPTRATPLDIGFNITYLLDVLQNMAMERVELAFGDANSSALVTVPDRDDYKYVVMPMRI